MEQKQCTETNARSSQSIMNSNSSQIGHTPSEQIFENITNEIDITQILSTELVTTSQPFVTLNTTNMIPSPRQVIGHVALHNNTTTRQEGRRRRRPRQRQRRRQRQEEERRIEQQQLQQELGRSRREYQRRQQQQRQQQWGAPRTERQQQQQAILPLRRQRSRTWSEIDREHEYWVRLGYPEYLEEFDDKLLEEYDLEKTDPKERWEQEQLNEFEGFAALEQLLLIQDQSEQDHQIKATEKMLEEEQEEINQEQYIQLQLWEHVAFAVQQLNEN